LIKTLIKRYEKEKSVIYATRDFCDGFNPPNAVMKHFITLVSCLKIPKNITKTVMIRTLFTKGDLKNTAAACSRTSTLTMINKRAFEELN
jgi:hypothetical protein